MVISFFLSIGFYGCFCVFCDLAQDFGKSGDDSHFCLSRCFRVDTWWADHWAGALVVSGFFAECTLCVALVLANNGGFLEDVHTSGEAFQSLGDLLGRVEGLGLLEDVLAPEQTLQGLADLLGCVEGLGFLEDVLAPEQTLQGLADLFGCVEGLGFLEDVLAPEKTLQRLADLLGDLLGRLASGVGDAVGDTHREVNIQWASPRVVDAGERSITDRANHY